MQDSSKEKIAGGADTMLFAEELRRRERREKRAAPFWQTMSFLLHIIMFGLLVYFTPLREIVIPEEKPRESSLSNLTAEQIERMSENVLEIRRNEIAQQLEELQTMLHNMEFMRNEILKDYDELVKHESQSAAKDMAQLFADVITKQEEAVKWQEDSLKNIETDNRNKAADLNNAANIKNLSASMEKSRETLEKASDAQGVSENLLDVVSSRAQFLGMSQTSQAAAKARETQIEINELQREVNSAADSSRFTMYNLVSNEERIQPAKDKADSAKKKFDSASAELDKRKKEYEEADRRKKQADKELADAKKSADSAVKQEKDAANALNKERNVPRDKQNPERIAAAEKKLAGARDLVKKTGTERSSAEKARNQADSDLRKVSGTKSSAERALSSAKRERENAERYLKSVLDSKASSTEKIRGAADSLKKQETEAIKMQKAILEQVKLLAVKAAEEEAVIVRKSVDEFRENPETLVDYSSLDLADAYAKAKDLENEISERYRDIKAAGLAMLTQTSLEAAEKLTDVAKPVRPDFDAGLLRSDPRTEADFLRKKEEMANVVSEAGNMTLTSEALMRDAERMVKPYGEGEEDGMAREERLRRMYALTELNKAISEAAAEDSSQRTKDMTGLMAGAQSMIEKTMSGEERGEEGSPMPVNTGVSQTPPAGELEAPKLAGNLPNLVGGNIIGRDGIPAEWMFLNSWYVIGPFDNPNRINIRRKFPPESVIDLDATYVGKGGKRISWEFEQASASSWNFAHRALMVPGSSEAYGIWYAYTEVFVEKDCDMWLAIGSDDRSDLWINGFHVWGSSNELKSWRIDEGFRKIHLNAGRNKLLARIENGWHVLGWSVCLAPVE